MDKYELRVDKTDTCWNWTGARRPPYGVVTIKGKAHGIHRVFYEHYIGKIEQGMVIDHLCRNTLCVNPEHLEQVTNSENAKRAIPYRTKPHHQKTVCKYGHELNEGNLYYSKQGVRRCKTCTIIYQRKYNKH